MTTLLLSLFFISGLKFYFRKFIFSLKYTLNKSENYLGIFRGVTEMVGDPGSLYFTKVFHWMIELTCSVRKAFLLMPNPFLTVHKSFRNLA